MPRRPNPVPTYRLHKQSGQAVVTVRGPDGRRRDVLLGRYDSPESKAEYERVLAELRASPAAVAPPSGSTAGLTVSELLLAFLRHCQGYYPAPADGGTGPTDNFKLALRPVRELYGPTPAAGFGPLALKAVRQRMVDAGLSRTTVNARVGMVRRCWKWAAAEELVPFAAFQALTSVAGLARGRTPAPETEPVRPVAPELVAATVARLGRHVAAMVQVQQLTGMRPAEVCRLRACDLDRGGAVWTYTPPKHKNAHRGKPRRVKVGPQAQAVLLPFLAAAGPDGYLFSPARARAERFAAMRAARRSRVTPSQVCRKKARPEREPGEAYTTRSYTHAIHRAADRAGVERWGPNRLRHTAATDVRKRFGLEAAQVLLGHSKADVTQVYAERDDALAERVAAAVG